MEVVQWGAGIEQGFALLQGTAAQDDAVQLLQFAALQVGRKTMRAYRAGAAVDAFAGASTGGRQAIVFGYQNKLSRKSDG
ncbi:hypothetical protein D3C84_1141430 [compost metagenome]